MNSTTRLRGNTVIINGKAVANNGAYRAVSHPDATCGPLQPESERPVTLGEMPPMVTTADLQPATTRIVAAAERTSRILDAEAWAQHADGNPGAATALWHAMTVLDREMDRDLPEA